jgi:hypothetical protein
VVEEQLASCKLAFAFAIQRADAFPFRPRYNLAPGIDRPPTCCCYTRMKKGILFSIVLYNYCE